MKTNGKDYGAMWILLHWLLPAKASKEDALILLEKAYDQWETGIEISERNDW